jgi:hypothetical protein
MVPLSAWEFPTQLLDAIEASHTIEYDFPFAE